MAERICIKDIHFYMRNVRTRMPFKYGVATLTSVPILHVLLDGELEDGTPASGCAADILPPKWFDKDPAKDYARNVKDLLFVAQAAATAYAEAAKRPRTVFAIWRDGYGETLAAGDEQQLNHLTASHGSSLMERALIDAVGVARGQTYFSLLRSNALGIELGHIHSELAGVEPADIIGPKPLGSIAVRHCVGLADPITTDDIAPEERLADGLPQALDEYVETQRLTHFKVKVSGELEADIDRLRTIAALLKAVCPQCSITLDGNEQYKDMAVFSHLIERMEIEPDLQTLLDRVLYIEQPLDRAIALDAEMEAGIRAVAARKPMLVDETDGDLDSFKEAMQLGYTGASSKNCKGLIKAVANQGLAKLNTERTGRPHFLSAEDLMNLPVVPLHQDLAHVAALGIDHAERNGHHYVRGLDHLSSSERDECDRRHSGLYGRHVDSLRTLKINDGRIDVRSLQAPGLGVGIRTDVASMIPLAEWGFDSL